MVTSSLVVPSMSTPPASLSLSIIFTAYGLPVALWKHRRTTLEIPLKMFKLKFVLFLFNMYWSIIKTNKLVLMITRFISGQSVSSETAVALIFTPVTDLLHCGHCG